MSVDEEFLRDRDGRILRDRYGRPVRRRGSTPKGNTPHGGTPQGNVPRESSAREGYPRAQRDYSSSQPRPSARENDPRSAGDYRRDAASRNAAARGSAAARGDASRRDATRRDAAGMYRDDVYARSIDARREAAERRAGTYRSDRAQRSHLHADGGASRDASRGTHEAGRPGVPQGTNETSMFSTRMYPPAGAESSQGSQATPPNAAGQSGPSGQTAPSGPRPVYRRVQVPPPSQAPYSPQQPHTSAPGGVLPGYEDAAPQRPVYSHQQNYANYAAAPRPQASRQQASRQQAPVYGAAVNHAAGAADVAPGVSRKPRRGFRMRPGGCLRGLGVLIVVIMLALVATAVWVDTSINRVAFQPAARVANSGGTNWLLVGSDSRQGLNEDDVQRLGTGGDIGVGRTDTIMVLHMNMTGKPTLLSIPRDSYASVPGFGMEKINAAFALGGPELLVATVEQSTGLRIDHYAEIGFGGFAGMVDAVGGVTLCPDQDINDPLAQLNVVAGCQEMDGPTALGFVRTRATAEGDLDRVRRQREFFAALVNKTTSAGTLLNPIKDVRLANAVKNSFTIGEGDHVWSLARLALAAAGGVDMETMPVGGFADTEVGNVVLWDAPEATALLQRMGVKNPPAMN